MSEAMQRFVTRAGLQRLDRAHLEVVTAWAMRQTVIRLEDSKLATPVEQPDGNNNNRALGAAFDKAFLGLAGEVAHSPIADLETCKREADVGHGTATDSDALQHGRRLFVSYSHADRRFVERLCSDLRNRGIQVWQDERELNVGDSIAEKIRQGIGEVDYVLTVVSPEATVSPWVRREIDVALNLEFDGRIRGLLPILRREATLPSLLEGRLYADFRGRRYEKPFQRLLRAIGEDPATTPILLGVIIRSRYIDRVVNLLSGHGWEARDRWEPSPARAEVTGGYFTYMRGDREARNGEPRAFPPQIQLPLIPDLPVLRGCGTQVAFGVMRVDYLADDVVDRGTSTIYLPSWKNILYITGQANCVRALVHLLTLLPHHGDKAVRWGLPMTDMPMFGEGISGDLLTTLKWWDRPQVPLGTPTIVTGVQMAHVTWKRRE